MEKVKQFYEALANDEKMKEKAMELNKKHSGEQPDEVAVTAEIIAFAAAEGYVFTAEEYAAFVQHLKSGSTELSDDELESVAGGFFAHKDFPCWNNCLCVVGGAGQHSNPRLTCACAAAGYGPGCDCADNPWNAHPGLICLFGGTLVGSAVSVPS